MGSPWPNVRRDRAARMRPQPRANSRDVRPKRQTLLCSGGGAPSHPHAPFGNRELSSGVMRSEHAAAPATHSRGRDARPRSSIFGGTWLRMALAFRDRVVRAVSPARRRQSRSRTSPAGLVRLGGALLLLLSPLAPALAQAPALDQTGAAFSSLDEI